MRYYGYHTQRTSNAVIVTSVISILRYEGISSQTAVSLPQQHSNNAFTTRLDLMYLCEDSGSITVTECNTNPDLVGLTIQPGSAYVPEALFGNNIVKLQSSNTVPIFTGIHGAVNCSVSYINTAVVDGTFTLPANTYAAVVEGTITIANTTLDSNTDLFIIGPKPTDVDVGGSGKLIMFGVEEGTN